MTQEEKARLDIDEKLIQAGWAIQDMKELILSASLGVAVREFPTSTGEVDYALFVEGKPVGIVETKREENGIGSYIVRTVYSPRIPCAFPINSLSLTYQVTFQTKNNVLCL